MVTTNRVRLGELLPQAPAEAVDVDLGPAPPVGSSRLFAAAELVLAARRAGALIVVSDSIRAIRATKHWTQLELRQLLTNRLQSLLPRHARLLQLDVPQTLATSTTAELSRVTLGQIPSRQGAASTSAVAEFTGEGRIEHRVVVAVTLELSTPPKPIELPQGSPLNLTIRLGLTQVSARAVTLQPATIGSITLVRVLKTRKTLRSKILTESTAEVLTP